MHLLCSIVIVLIHHGIFVRSDLMVSKGSHRMPYKIFVDQYRIKRDGSSWFYPDVDKNRISCEPNIYEKLTSCSHFTDCSGIASCFDTVHCPLNVKSHGSLIYNLLQLLGVTNCPIHDEFQTCSHIQRVNLLQNLLVYWTAHRNSDYCNSASTFIAEVRRQVQEQCPMHYRQVQSFTENYFCLTQPTTHSTDLDYIDEDTELKFLNIDKSLENDTDHTIYVDDHQYYNVSYVIPNLSERARFMVEDFGQFTPIHLLSNRHRSALKLDLKFSFPFYGHLVNRILIATGGFIYTGDLLQPALIGSTQYIAPFMANFDGSLGSNETEIQYFDNTTHFVCTWKKVYLQDQQDLGPFSFQVMMDNTGRIIFNYIEIPSTKISTANHAYRIGLSDAYLSQHSTNEHIVRVITVYNRIDLNLEKVRTGVSVVFDMDQTCNTFTDCSSCLANRGKRYNCSWCDDIQKCSDGYDRSRQQWIRTQCHRLASVDYCPSSIEQAFQKHQFQLSTMFPTEKSSIASRSNTILQTFRTILITLLLSVLVLALIALVVGYVYAYRHPTSVPGMWLIEHRPSTYIARFKRTSTAT